MLEKALAETDPQTTEVVVMTSKLMLPNSDAEHTDFDHYDRELMTSVVDRAEKVGKQVKPLIMPTNNPLYAIVNTAKTIGAQELIIGASNKYTANEQLEQIAFYWISVNEGQMQPFTVRILSRACDVYFDLAGGNRIPKISERQARSVAELRSAGVGVNRALLTHFDNPESSDLFKAVLTMLDPQVALTIVPVTKDGAGKPGTWVQQDLDRAQQLKRELDFAPLPEGPPEPEIVRLAHARSFDLVIIGLPSDSGLEGIRPFDTNYIIQHAPCRICLVTPAVIPEGLVDK
jgi:nucleotide-binding universal stress UspA family protein